MFGREEREEEGQRQAGHIEVERELDRCDTKERHLSPVKTHA